MQMGARIVQRARFVLYKVRWVPVGGMIGLIGGPDGCMAAGGSFGFVVAGGLLGAAGGAVGFITPADGCTDTAGISLGTAEVVITVVCTRSVVGKTVLIHRVYRRLD